jgi:hypothetical protein
VGPRIINSEPRILRPGDFMAANVNVPNVERSHAGLMACECNHDGRPALAVAMC